MVLIIIEHLKSYVTRNTLSKKKDITIMNKQNWVHKRLVEYIKYILIGENELQYLPNIFWKTNLSRLYILNNTALSHFLSNY